MKKLIGIIALAAVISAPAFAKEAKKPADFVITVANAGTSALTSLTVIFRNWLIRFAALAVLVEVPEAVTGLIGALLIAAALWDSARSRARGG